MNKILNICLFLTAVATLLVVWSFASPFIYTKPPPVIIMKPKYSTIHTQEERVEKTLKLSSIQDDSSEHENCIALQKKKMNGMCHGYHIIGNIGRFFLLKCH